MSDIHYSIIIPAYNEEDRILATLNSYYNFFKQSQDKRFEIIISINSPDKTIDIVNAFSRDKREMKILSTDRPLGKGGAILKGFQGASGNIIGFTDADESVKPEDFYNLIRVLENGEQKGVIGTIASRYIKTSVVLKHERPIRKILSRALNVLARALFGLKYNDTQCGAKVFCSQYIKKNLAYFKTKGYEFDVELLWKLRQYGIIKEVGITWEAKAGSTFRINSSFGMLWNLLKLKLSDTCIPLP